MFVKIRSGRNKKLDMMNLSDLLLRLEKLMSECAICEKPAEFVSFGGIQAHSQPLGMV